MAIDSDQLEFANEEPRIGPQYQKIAALYLYVDDYSSALVNMDTAMSFYDKEGLSDGFDTWNERWASAFKAYILALAGKRTEAQKLMDTVLKSIDTTELNSHQSYYYVIGRFHFGMGEYREAIKYLNMAANIDATFIIKELTGRSYLADGQIGKAVEELQAASTEYSKNRGYWMTEGVMVYYWLGRAYEASGWNERAAEQYKNFLDIFKNADPNVINIDDAKGRLARLTHGS